MAKKNSSFLVNIIQITAWILVLSAFGVTLGDIISFDWVNRVGELLVNFFSW